ncbi:MAG: lytic murein transglycosylase [Gammaproteobacteria bacterium]|nr:lytic murein transglycosylase [Gammaproteobacteria bacterium]
MSRFYFLIFCLISALLPPLTASAQQQSFAEWLGELRAEARSLGIGEETLAALDGIAPLGRVLELDGDQPEFVQTFTRYIDLRVTPGQIGRGRQLLREHAGLLAEVRARYGVQPHYLVAFWAIETNFGSTTGGFSVLEALATLAYDPRRADFFREQLLTALWIIDDGHIAAERMTGSWAGAMGQLQFLPTVFRNYAVDGDGDGRADIWGSLPDVFHSAANFISQSGWRGDERWGREVVLPEGFDYALVGARDRKPLAQWRDLGLRTVAGEPIPVADMEAAVALPAGAAGPAFLTYNNFRVTMRYNPSVFYAITVGHLADRFTGGPAIAHMPENETALSRVQVAELQEHLNRLGFDSGEADGRVGSRTRAAIRAYQFDHGLIPDGHASLELLDGLRN